MAIQFHQTKKTHSSTHKLVLVTLVGMLSTAVLSSCGAPETTSSQLKNTASAPASSALPRAESQADNLASTQKPDSPKTAPQLIKKASINIIVNSIEKNIKEVTRLVHKNQGDIMGLEDNNPQDSSVRRIATMEIRVPQEKLDILLEELAKLGALQNRTLKAEDVSQQLVDVDARLRNLRKSEEMTLKIMDRSGSVGDILKVSQQLNTIRSDIERLDAQQKNLRSQVAFSSIIVTLESAISAQPKTEPSVGLRVQETWGKATNSMNEFTIGLLGLGLWLLAFSPYLLLGAGLFYGVRKWKKKKALPPAPPTEVQSN